MGQHGPIPKRSAERRRRNKDAQVEKVTPLPASKRKPAPRPKTTWHPAMKKWFSALGRSAQAQFYEPSDWAEAELWCEVVSAALKSKKGVSAFLLASFSAFSSRLLTTEGDRRRVRLEIEREDPAEPAVVTSLAEFRESLRA